MIKFATFHSNACQYAADYLQSRSCFKVCGVVFFLGFDFNNNNESAFFTDSSSSFHSLNDDAKKDDLKVSVRK